MSEISKEMRMMLAKKKAWILDVDDCLYPIDNGFHNKVKQSIVREFARISTGSGAAEKKLFSYFSDLLKDQGFYDLDPAMIDTKTVGIAFPAMVQSLLHCRADNMHADLAKFYGDHYDDILPDPELVIAFRDAQKKGITIYLYTNGPSHPDQGGINHVQKTLNRLGFDTDEIEALKARSYDLLKAIQDGAGKPTNKSMERFLAFSNIDPEDALMIDDSVENIATAHRYGIAPIWSWSSSKTPPAQKQAIADQINAPRIKHTGQFLRGLTH